MGRDRRRYPRASIGLDVTVEATGRLWKGKTVDLSPYGAKVASPATSAKLPPGTSVQLRFPGRGHGARLSLTASVVRTDPDGMALSFGSLEDRQFQRLKDFVGSALLREWQELLQDIGAGQRLDDRAVAPTQPNLPPEEPPVTTGDHGSKKDRWQALLNQIGLDVQLPSNGSLSRQWLEFLERLEDQCTGSRQ